jgi:hypothetical protein
MLKRHAVKLLFNYEIEFLCIFIYDFIYNSFPMNTVLVGLGTETALSPKSLLPPGCCWVRMKQGS